MNERKTLPDWRTVLLSFLAATGGSTLVINLDEPRPDPHTGKDDAAVMLRQNIEQSEMELRLTERINRLEDKVNRHKENKEIHIQDHTH